MLEYEDAWKLVLGTGNKGTKTTEQPIGPKEGLQGTMDHIHMRNWLECARAGKKDTHCTAEHGYQHAIACIMADKALHSGRRVQYDAKARKIVSA